MHLYVNGVQESTTAQSGTVNAVSQSLFAGKTITNGVSQGYLSGALDELRVYGQALTAAEVQDLYASNTPAVFSTFTGACPFGRLRASSESAKGWGRQPHQEGGIGADDGRTLP